MNTTLFDISPYRLYNPYADEFCSLENMQTKLLEDY